MDCMDFGEAYAVRHSEGWSDVKGGLKGKSCCGNATLRMSKEGKNGNQM